MVAKPEHASNLTLGAFRPVVDSLDLSPLEAGGLPPLPKGVPSLRTQVFIAGSVLVHCIAIACLVAFSSTRPEPAVDEIPLEVVVMAPPVAGAAKPAPAAQAGPDSSAVAVIRHVPAPSGWAEKADSEGRPARIVMAALPLSAEAMKAPQAAAAPAAPAVSDTPVAAPATHQEGVAQVAAKPAAPPPAAPAPLAVSSSIHRPAEPVSAPPAPVRAPVVALAAPVHRVGLQDAKLAFAPAPAAPPAGSSRSPVAPATAAIPPAAVGAVPVPVSPPSRLPAPDKPVFGPDLPAPASLTPGAPPSPESGSVAAVSPPSATDASVTTPATASPAAAAAAPAAPMPMAPTTMAPTTMALAAAGPVGMEGVPADVPLPPLLPQPDVPLPPTASVAAAPMKGGAALAAADQQHRLEIARAARRAEQARRKEAAAEKARHAREVAAASRAYRLLIARRIHDFQKYPETSRVNGEQGTVVVSFSVAADGRVTAARVLRSSGHPALDAETIAAIHRASPMPKPPPLALHSYTAPFAYKLQK